MSGALTLAGALLFIAAMAALSQWWDAEEGRQQRVRGRRQIARQTDIAIAHIRAQYDAAAAEALRRAMQAPGEQINKGAES